MKKVILKELSEKTIVLSKVDEDQPIFVIENGMIVGMVTKEKDGWIIVLGGDQGYAGHKATREIAMQNTEYEFYINPEIK